MAPMEIASNASSCNWWDINCQLKQYGLPPLPPSVATPFTPWTGPPGQPNPYMPGGGKVMGGTAPSWAQAFLGDTTIWSIVAGVAAVGAILMGLWMMAGSPPPKAVPVPV